MIRMNVKRAFALWLIWMCWFSASGLSAQTKYISTQEELIEVLNSPTTRAGEEKPINPDGIAIDSVMPVSRNGVRLFGGPLYRAEGYDGSLLKILNGGNVTIENTLDGKDLTAKAAILKIEEGGSATLADGGKITNAACNIATLKNTKVVVRTYSAAVENDGTFIMDGGMIVNNSCGGTQSSMISTLGSFYFRSGGIVGNQSDYSIVGKNIYFYGDAQLEGYIRSSNPIILCSALKYSLRIHPTSMSEGEVLVKGMNTTSLYTITEADVERMDVDGLADSGYSLRLETENNQVILSKESSSSDVISTEEELREALASGPLGSIKEVKIAEAGIAITENIRVGTGYYNITGGSLYRASGFKGVMLTILKNASVTINNTLDGKNVANSNPLLDIQEGGSVVLRGTLQNNEGFEHALVVNNAGTFTLNGGIIRSNKGEANHLIMNFGILYLTEGVMQDNICEGSVSNNSTTVRTVSFYLASRGVRLGEIESHMWADKDAPILLTSELATTLTIHTHSNNGDVIAKGANDYQLTQSDINNIRIVNGQIQGQTVKLEDNQAVLTTESEDDGDIDTEKELQDYLNCADGTEEKPTEIKLDGEIVIEKGLTIEGKFIHFVGGTLVWKGGTAGGSVITIKGGGLSFEGTTINGGNTGTGYRMVSLINIQGGATVTMGTGSILRGAGLTSDVSAVWIFDGNFIMNGGSIEYNYFYGDISMASVISIYKGHFVMNGGYIQNNVGENFRIIGIFGYTNKEAYFEYAGGTIYKNEGGYIDFNGGYWLCALPTPSNYTLVGNVSINPNNVIHLTKSLSFKITFIIRTGVTLPDKFALIQGYSYTITENDLKYIVVPEGYSLVLEDNIIYLVKGGTSSGITTQEELQAAIDNSKGTASSPEFIDLGTNKILIYSSIVINNKYVVLVDGTLVNAATADLRMFDIRSGLLRLAGTVLDGNKSQAHGYCTLIEMNGGKCQIVEDTKLTNALARGGSDAVVTVAKGELEFNLGSITGNDSEGGDIIWVSGNGKFSMNGGTISSNRNVGRYIMASIQMTNGVMGINSGTIGDNSGSLYGLYVTKAFTLKGDANIKEVIILNGDGKILVSSALKHKVTVGHMTLNLPSGTIVASGTNNYQLTQADVKQFAYRTANKYSFSLSGNNIILNNLDAANRSFNIKAEAYQYGTIKASKATAKGNEVITVTVEPKSGYHLQEGSLRYNEVNKLTEGTQANTFTFKMPPSDVVLTAQFIPEKIDILTPVIKCDPVPCPNNPEENLTPDDLYIDDIDELEDYLNGLGGDNHELTPEISYSDPEGWDGPLSAAVEEGEGNGDDYISSIEELIGYVSKDKDGNVLKTETLKIVPGGCILRVKLPDRLIVSQQLRASGTANYYILRECDEEVTKIIPEYNEVNNTLTFETDKMGTFVVMNGKDPVANENIHAEHIQIKAIDGQLSIQGLEPGERFSIYDMSGKLLHHDVSDGSATIYTPKAEGVYIIATEHAGSFKVSLTK